MIDGLRLELKDIEPIVNADLDINKINIVGGKNATGKSTASKLLYCFLKVNSADRAKLVTSTIIKALRKIFTHFRVYEDRDYTVSELNHRLREMRRMLVGQRYDDFEEVIDLFEEIEPLFNKALKKTTFKYAETGELFPTPRSEKLLAEFKKVKRILNSVEDNSSEFFKEVMRDLLSSEFDIDFSYNVESDNSPNYRINYAKLYDSENSNFSFEVKLNDIGKEFESKGEFYVSNVFYLESFSFFDTYSSFRDEYLHIEELKEYLFPRKRVSKMFEDESIDKLEKIVNRIVGGRIVEDKFKGLKFVSNDSSYTCSMKNTASGIKQISVIQTLLHNRFLGDDCVLIIDEPEVNLHPEWQIKLARILVLLAKEGNITLYINTHSPMFIEAIDTFCEYYDFEKYVNYYLSKKLEDDKIETEEDKTKAKFERIPSDELYKIYDNLGDPFDYLDKVRLSKGKKGVVDDLDF